MRDRPSCPAAWGNFPVPNHSEKCRASTCRPKKTHKSAHLHVLLPLGPRAQQCLFIFLQHKKGLRYLRDVLPCKHSTPLFSLLLHPQLHHRSSRILPQPVWAQHHNSVHLSWQGVWRSTELIPGWVSAGCTLGPNTAVLSGDSCFCK